MITERTVDLMKIKDCIKSTWEFPQNALGAIVEKVCKATPYTTYKDSNVYSWNINRGLSLGKYIFVPYHSNVKPTAKSVQNYIKHEYGHTIQSKYLGWFYLLVIGLPSLIWAGCFEGYRQKTGKSYYSFYTEKWADKLGGVDNA
jgi:hypothetical protein